MSFPSQTTPELQANAGLTTHRANDDVARASVLWASFRNHRVTLFFKRFGPLVKLVRALQRYCGLLAGPSIVAEYLRSNAVRKLQIGADVWQLPGWLNTDLHPKAFGCITLDATKPFPFRSATFDYILSEHQMEHIAYGDAANMLRECHRVLRPGGKLRIALPCVDRLLALFASSRTDLQEKYIAVRTGECYRNIGHPNPCFAINAAFMNWGHRFLYDRATLRSLLEEIGYTDVQFFEAGQSDDPNLAGVEMRTAELDLYETMVVQAVRGGSE